MSNRGIVEFYYTANLPANSVALAKITSQDYTPDQVVSINNTIYQQGPLSLWKSATSLTGPADFTAPALSQSIAINGDTTYYIGNQFFQITDVLSPLSNPLYYKHSLPSSVTSVTVLDSDGNILSEDIIITNSALYHDLPDGIYSIRYVDSVGFVQTTTLLFTPAYSRSGYATGAGLYTYSNRILTMAGTGTYHLRFTVNNGYQSIAPYNAPSNTPWFLRVRYGITPTPPEWSKQPFIPTLPYLLGTWVSGTLLENNIIQLERTGIYYDANHLPDLLIFDQNNNIKYAVDGTSVLLQSTKGFEYPWKQGLISFFDPDAGRISLTVTIDPTDIIFAFYSYYELDVLFTDLDINPFTNPLVRNAEIDLYYKTDGINPLKYLYYSITDSSGDIVGTNDTSPTTGTNYIFSNIGVGTSISTSQINVEDIRVRGGGLQLSSQSIPEAVNFWDLGYWDGKPYPSAGCLVLYLPYAILNSISRSAITDRIQAILPLGIYPVVRYYDTEGNEYV